MADTCKDIDKALANLARQIEAQNACCNANKQQIANLNRRVSALERGSNTSNTQGQNKPTDLTEVYRRLSKIEALVGALERFVLAMAPLLQVLQKFPLFRILL